MEHHINIWIQSFSLFYALILIFYFKYKGIHVWGEDVRTSSIFTAAGRISVYLATFMTGFLATVNSFLN